MTGLGDDYPLFDRRLSILFVLTSSLAYSARMAGVAATYLGSFGRSNL